jgi:hypothetical protein
VLALRQRIHRLDASVVIFDVMAKFMPGADENSVAEISPMMNTLREIANQTGTTFILIHHLNKGGNPDLSYRVRVPLIFWVCRYRHCGCARKPAFITLNANDHSTKGA